MGITENLNGSEAIEKLKELADGKTCMMSTYAGAFQLDSRPMTAISVDDEGTFWFFTKKESLKIDQLSANPQVELLFLETKTDNYLAVTGNASFTQDAALIDEHYHPIIGAWFPEGKEDPSLTLIAVKPAAAHYWDTQHGKMISTIKMMAAAITGNGKDDGREGDLDI